ncbi:MAG: hypothetical protein WBE37_08670 [Bryobacteraceae bacterium]
MTNVQIAISDPDYAEALRDLLVADGQHQVCIVNCPNPAIHGVVVVDDSIVSPMTAPPGLDFDRCVIFTQKVTLDANQLWEAGVCHVIHPDQPPHVGLLVVLAAEKRLGGTTVFDPERPMFDETDKLFLQSLRISD